MKRAPLVVRTVRLGAASRLRDDAYPAFILCNRSRNLCDWHFVALQYDWWWRGC
jgi:hypothetical protein